MFLLFVSRCEINQLRSGLCHCRLAAGGITAGARPSHLRITWQQAAGIFDSQEIKVNSASRIVYLFVVGAFTLSSESATSPNRPQSDQSVQVVEVTAKKYEYSPSPIRAKRGAPVQLRFTSLDKTHGFKINLYPDGADAKGEPGLVFSSNEDCFKLEKGTPTVVQFVPRTAGTYSFHCCNRCGLGHGGMKAQLVVEP